MVICLDKKNNYEIYCELLDSLSCPYDNDFRGIKAKKKKK